MTVCGFNVLGSTSPTNNQMHVQRILTNFADAVKASGEIFRGQGVTVRQSGGGKAIRLDVASVAPAGPFLALRRALREVCGKAVDQPVDRAGCSARRNARRAGGARLPLDARCGAARCSRAGLVRAAHPAAARATERRVRPARMLLLRARRA